MSIAQKRYRSEKRSLVIEIPYVDCKIDMYRNRAPPQLLHATHGDQKRTFSSRRAVPNCVQITPPTHQTRLDVVHMKGVPTRKIS